MKVLMNKGDMERTLERLAYQIMEKYENLDNLILVGIVRRGVYLSNRLAKILQEKTGKNVTQGTLDISLYRDDWTTLAAIPELTASDIPVTIEGKRVILVDDVLSWKLCRIMGVPAPLNCLCLQTEGTENCLFMLPMWVSR